LDKEYLIHGKPLRVIFLFSLPMIIGNLFQQFYNMVDSVVVGRFVSESALAAVGASYSLTNVFICIAIGGGVGASVITGRFFGARQYEKMKQSAYTAIIAFVALSVLLGIAGILFGREIMVLLKTPEDILDMATVYLNIYFIGFPFLFMYNVLSAMFNALGKSRTPLVLLVFSSILNVALDIFMVGTLNMGIAGAAWATLIAQGLSAVISFVLFLRMMKGFRCEKHRAFDLKLLKNISGIAAPSILQQSTVSIGMMLVQAAVNSFGTQALAGFTAAMRVDGICCAVMIAVGNAMSPYISQNIGAGLTDRVSSGLKSGIALVAVYAVLTCVATEVFAGRLISLFLGEDGTEKALVTGIACLRFSGWFYFLLGLKQVIDGVLRGAGDMKMFTIANLANLAIRVGAAVGLSPVFGIGFIWYAVPFGWLANFLISFGQYRTGKWKTIPAA